MAAERPSKKEEAFREERRRLDPTGPSARGGHPMPRSGPGNRGPNSLHPPPTAMGPPGSHGGSGSHKDIKLTLLTKVTKGYDPNVSAWLVSWRSRFWFWLLLVHMSHISSIRLILSFASASW